MESFSSEMQRQLPLLNLCVSSTSFQYAKWRLTIDCAADARFLFIFKSKSENEEWKTKNGKRALISFDHWFNFPLILLVGKRRMETKNGKRVLLSFDHWFNPYWNLFFKHMFFSRISRNATWRRKNVFRLLSVVVPRSVEKTVSQKNHFRLLSDNRQRGLYEKYL